jgi:hypothetical protein
LVVSADSLMPALSRVYVPLLWAACTVLWLIGVTCALLVLFDQFEAGSTQEWLASAASALALPVIVFNIASLNAKTVRQLFKEFQTWYVLVNVLGFACLLLFLFREHPAKIVALALWTPSYMMAGLVDGAIEGKRLLISRIFFTLNIPSILVCLALVSFKLGAFTDYTFELSTFAFVASSMVCSTITTLLVFGAKNLALSFYRPGSLVVLRSSMCCFFLDADTLAVMKSVYSLQGQPFRKYAPNKTMQLQLHQDRASIAAAAGALTLAATAVAPGQESAPEIAETQQEPQALHMSLDCAHVDHGVVEEERTLGSDSRCGDGARATADAEPGHGTFCAPFDLQAARRQ